MTRTWSGMRGIATVPTYVVMQPTTLCNLNCSYCYLPFRAADNRMPVEVATAVAAAVDGFARTGRFSVVWHGGEPLASGRDHLAALLAPFGDGVEHHVQTNATLIDDAWCRFFTEHGVRVSVSVDGPEARNGERVTRGGRPAYDRILRGVEALRRHDIPFSALCVVGNPQPGVAAELYAYNLEVRKDAILINGDNENGVFYGIQSLIQLLPVERSASLKIPFVAVKDYPRFKYRGLHLDVGRHFFPVEFVKKYIDYIALHKMNYFHWHLTEDQGWRIEIKKYPKLTSVGGYRNGTIIGRYPGKGNDNTRYGGFYTQAQVKEIVDYAAKRYIEVIPEIEMPGHASAALTAYPHLGCTGGPYKVQETWGVFKDVFCAGNDSVFTFLQDVLNEVIPLFPAKYVHIGGDECPKDSWKVCPKCQKRKAAHNLKDEHELQSYFVQRMEKFINSKGKVMIGWDEILEGGLAPNAVVMSWRGEAGGIEAAKQNHDVIMTPGSHVYLDHTQTKNEDSVTIGGYTTVQKTYSYEPVPKELSAEEAKHVLGAQGNVWTEYMKYPSKVEYMIFPRLSALSEVLWSPKEKKNWDNFRHKLQIQFQRYGLWNANYSKAIFDLNASLLPAPDNNGAIVHMNGETPFPDQIEIEENYGQEITVERIIQIPDLVKDRDGSKGLMKDSLSHLTGKKFTHSYFAPFLVPAQPGGVVDITMKSITYKAKPISLRLNMHRGFGKKINLNNPPSEKYPGSGAFTLVNGVVSERGLGDAESFLGFEGTDLEAVIDLGSLQKVNSVTLYSFSQPGSWVYHPRAIEVQLSNDGSTFAKPANAVADAQPKDDRHTTVRLSSNNEPIETRYVKVQAKNFGTIPDGQPGAGSRAWLFVDEIQVN